MNSSQTLKRKSALLAAAIAVTALSSTYSSQAAAVIWGNNASAPGGYTEVFDKSTGALLDSYATDTGNGRGVVVVGNVLYTTQVGDNKIYEWDVTTHAALGSISTANASMSTLAWDGSAFWTADYSGSNHAFRIDPTTGNNLVDIALANAIGNMDGLEYFNGKLIANREDATGPYDVYDLSGNVLQAAFITPNYSSTGIAFDGNDFWVSDIVNQKIHAYDGVTGLEIPELMLSLGTSTLSSAGRLLEDLSVDYALREDTGNPVPEPSTVIGGLALAGLAASKMLRRKKA